MSNMSFHLFALTNNQRKYKILSKFFAFLKVLVYNHMAKRRRLYEII